MKPLHPERQTARLLAGRISAKGVCYFVTTCTAAREKSLPHIATHLSEAECEMNDAGLVQTLAYTCMPDHVHWLFELTCDEPVSRIIGRWKTASRRKAGWNNLHWQENFFEHRLREHETAEAFAYYIFMNPYRACICDKDTTWPHWRCPHPELFGFLSACRPGPLPSAASLAEMHNAGKPWLRLP